MDVDSRCTDILIEICRLERDCSDLYFKAKDAETLRGSATISLFAEAARSYWRLYKCIQDNYDTLNRVERYLTERGIIEKYMQEGRKFRIKTEKQFWIGVGITVLLGALGIAASIYYGVLSIKPMQ